MQMPSSRTAAKLSPRASLIAKCSPNDLANIYLRHSLTLPPRLMPTRYKLQRRLLHVTG
jgi:hypothetical protein